MRKCFIPFALADNIYDIDIDFFKKCGAKTIICDLDNTLDAYYHSTPSKEAVDLINKLNSEGFFVIVISNNKKHRVSKYCESLNCKYLYSAGKPFTARSKKFLQEENVDIKNAIYVGDQVFTDVVFGNRLSIRTILCENLVEKDQFFTKINKFFDRHLRKRMIKKNLVKSRKEI